MSACYVHRASTTSASGCPVAGTFYSCLLAQRSVASNAKRNEPISSRPLRCFAFLTCERPNGHILLFILRTGDCRSCLLSIQLFLLFDNGAICMCIGRLGHNWAESMLENQNSADCERSHAQDANKTVTNAAFHNAVVQRNDRYAIFGSRERLEGHSKNTLVFFLLDQKNGTMSHRAKGIP